MHKNLGSQGFHSKLFALLFALLFSTSSAWAASQYLVVMPGQSYSGSAAPNRYNPVTQVAGENITGIQVFCYDNATNLPVNSFPNTTSITSADPITVSPSGSFNLNESYGSPAVAYSRRQGITATIIPTTSKSVTLDLGGSGGILGDSTTIYVQRITHFGFTHGAFTAGTAGSLTVEARDGSGVCTGYNGTARLYCLDGDVNGGTRDLGNITFTNGVWTGNVTLYHATTLARFQVVKSTTPAVTTTEGTTFTINPNPSNWRLLIIGPGQTIRSGENGGNGRTSGSTTTSTQTAGSNFSVNVYVVDSYWNTVTGITSFDASLTCAGDPGFSADGPYTFSGATNARTFSAVHMEEAATQTLATSNTGSVTNSSDNVPVTPATLATFTIRPSSNPTPTDISNQTVPPDGTQGFTIYVRGYDAYGNLVSTVPGTTDIQVVDNGGTPLSWTYRSVSITPAFNSTQFAGDGTYNGTLKIYRALNNLRIRVTNTSIGNTDSNQFNVSPGAAYYNMVVMPGQTHTPGEYHSGWGRSGSASARTAGSSFSATILVTDRWGNLVDDSRSLTWSGSTHLTSPADADATCVPNPINIVNGSASVSYTLTRASTTQVLTLPNTGLTVRDSGTFTVNATSLDHFSFNTIGSQTAGVSFNTVITARDTYDNAITNYAGTVYLTCPNLDYLTPTESVMHTTAGYPYYTGVSTTACWRLSGFTPGTGQLTFSTTIYRAGSSQLYVSTVPEDTPSFHTGSVGNSASITVAQRSSGQNWTMFMIVPGLTHRPGGIDNSGTGAFAGNGFYGTPLAQQAGPLTAPDWKPFSVTIYATDLYYNIIPNASDQFNIKSSPSNSNVHDQDYTLINGARQLNVACSEVTGYLFNLVCSSSGVNTYGTPYSIQVFSINDFTIQHSGLQYLGFPAVPSVWTAGHPVWVTIVAHSDNMGNTATTFNGMVELACDLDHNSTLKTIRPATPIQFTAGIWSGNITLFRADSAPSHSIRVNLGTLSSNSTPNFMVNPDDNTFHPYKMLIMAPGMNRYAGLNPDVWPDFKGADGQPAVQTAGNSVTSMGFYICDNWWNTATHLASTAANVACSDSYPAYLEGSPVNPSIGITLTNGQKVVTNAFCLYKVRGTSGQTVTLTSAGTTPFELGSGGFNPIPVKHAVWGRSFTFGFPTTDKVAGVPFAVTIAAVDAYGNTLDSINGGVPMPTYSSVDLSAQTDGGGNKTIWPIKLGTLESTRWIEGLSRPWVYNYKKVSGGGHWMTAAYDFGEPGGGVKSGKSAPFNILANRYARVIPIIRTATSGMTLPDSTGAGGSYVYSSAYDSTPPAASSIIFNNFGTPATHTAGAIINMLRGYTCDAYGNVVNYPSVNIHMTSTDRYAPLPANQPASGGYATFGTAGAPFVFHTRQTTTITMADATVTTHTAGTTPSIPVVSGPAYGLQILAPGLTVIEGSGNSGVSGITPVPPNGWYTGVTPTDLAIAPLNSYNGRAQYSGAPFGVTILVSDVYGNFVGGRNDSISVLSDDMNSLAVPNTSVPVTGSLSNSVLYLPSIKLYESGPRTLKPSDVTAPTIVGDPSSVCVAQIVRGEQTRFAVYVNGVRIEDNTPVFLEAHPNTFNVQVKVIFTDTGEVVSSNQSFVMEPVLDQGASPTPATGVLSKTNGATFYGVADVTNQTYSSAERIFIRVREAGGASLPAAGFSPELRFRAAAAATIQMWSDATQFVDSAGRTVYQTEANKTARIFARVLDGNNPPNPVPGMTVSMAIDNPELTTSTLEIPVAGQTTDSNGEVYQVFRAGAQNLEHVVRATAGGASGQLSMYVTVTSNGGVYPNPFNPLREPAHIDYRLDQNAAVKIQVYTLFGDLVWSKEYAAGSEGGMAGVRSILWDGKNNVGQTVANGGYIVTVKVNDREKYRFKLGVFKEQ